MRQPFTGVGTALVTPFTATGALDESGVRRLVRRQIDEGVHFLVPCGTTGESPTLSDAERIRIVRSQSRKHVASCPCCRSGWIRHQRGDSCRAADAGCRRERLLSVTPYYNKPTPDASSNTKSHRRKHLAADHCLQRTGEDRVQCRSSDTRQACGDTEHRRCQRSLRQHSADVRNMPRGARRLSGAFWR